MGDKFIFFSILSRYEIKSMTIWSAGERASHYSTVAPKEKISNWNINIIVAYLSKYIKFVQLVYNN